jgi:hypothetical protein
MPESAALQNDSNKPMSTLCSEVKGGAAATTTATATTASPLGKPAQSPRQSTTATATSQMPVKLGHPRRDLSVEADLSARRIDLCGSTITLSPRGPNAVEPQPVASPSRAGMGPAVLSIGSGSAPTSPDQWLDASDADTSPQQLLHSLIKGVSQSDLRIRAPDSDQILLRDSAMTSCEPDTPAGLPPMADDQSRGGQAAGKTIFRI